MWRSDEKQKSCDALTLRRCVMQAVQPKKNQLKLLRRYLEEEGAQVNEREAVSPKKTNDRRCQKRKRKPRRWAKTEKRWFDALPLTVHFVASLEKTVHKRKRRRGTKAKEAKKKRILVLTVRLVEQLRQMHADPSLMVEIPPRLSCNNNDCNARSFSLLFFSPFMEVLCLCMHTE
jgi:hypothetical protein